MASEEDCSTRNVTWRRDRSLRKVGFAAAYPGGATVTATLPSVRLTRIRSGDIAIARTFPSATSDSSSVNARSRGASPLRRTPRKTISATATQPAAMTSVLRDGELPENTLDSGGSGASRRKRRLQHREARARRHPSRGRRAGDSVLEMCCCGALQPRRSVAGASDACKPLLFRIVAHQPHVLRDGPPRACRVSARRARLFTARCTPHREARAVEAEFTAIRAEHGSNRLFRLAIQALEGGLLPCRPAHRRVVRALRRDVRHRRDQQQLLPAARGAHVPQLAGARPRRVPLRGQGEPVPHAHEEAEGSRGAASAVLRERGTARRDAWSRAVPVAAALAARSRAAAPFRRDAAEARPARDRVPGAKLVRAGGARAARGPWRGALPARHDGVRERAPPRRSLRLRPLSRRDQVWRAVR